MSQFERLRRAYGALLTLCGLIAGAVTFLVMCLVVGNALLRYSLNAPISGTLEITESALPFMIFLALALTQYEGGHIKVVLLTQSLPAGPARAIRVLAMLLGLAFFAWAAWAGWLMVLKSWTIGELERGAVRFPLWPVKGVVFLGLALLAVQFLLDAVWAALGGAEPGAAEVLE